MAGPDIRRYRRRPAESRSARLAQVAQAIPTGMRQAVRVPLCSARGTLWRAALLLPPLNRFQIRQDGCNLVRVEDEFRHLRMTYGKSFGQSFRQAVDRIFA